MVTVVCALSPFADAITWAVPGARAAIIGGSSVESESTELLSVLQNAPLMTLLFWSVRCSVELSSPTIRDRAAGVRDTLGGTVTVSVVEAERLPKVELIVVVPAPMAVTSPVLLIVAIAVEEEFQVTEFVRSDIRI